MIATIFDLNDQIATAACGQPRDTPGRSEIISLSGQIRQTIRDGIQQPLVIAIINRDLRGTQEALEDTDDYTEVIK